MSHSSIRLTSALLPLLLSACSFLGIGSREYKPNPDPNHTHADFAVYIEGMKWDFGDAKYMSGLSTDEATHDEEGEARHKYFHLHDGVGHVLHRHKPGLTLGEFFGSLGFTMTGNCMKLDTNVDVCPERAYRWHMFVNGVEQPFDPTYVFADMDQILLTYQADDEVSKVRMQQQIKAMTDDACKYSQTCPWKGKPPTENCLADPEVPCVAPLE